MIKNFSISTKGNSWGTSWSDNLMKGQPCYMGSIRSSGAMNEVHHFWKLVNNNKNRVGFSLSTRWSYDKSFKIELGNGWRHVKTSILSFKPRHLDICRISPQCSHKPPPRQSRGLHRRLISIKWIPILNI